MPNPASTVHRVHFEDFDGSEFERLVFAYHWRSDTWRSLEWYGQTGSDLGRDIWGVRDNGESVCIQCANRSRLTFAKVESDLAKVLRAPHGIPHLFRIVSRANIPAPMRDKIKAHAKSVGVKECEPWSGAEFEEKLRHRAEALLKRFAEGEPFPDAPEHLKKIATSSLPTSDEEALAMMVRLFDRPAFYTPIRQESNLGDFKQAITDTIQALGTGIWKARDRLLIDRIPHRHELRSEALRTKLRVVEQALASLRAEFDEFVRSGVLRHCRCGQADCPTYFFSSRTAADELDRLRQEALSAFKEAYPPLRIPTW